MDFHEPVGLGDWKFEPGLRKYNCLLCESVFQSKEELREHRFTQHPLMRPVLFFRGQEIGNSKIVVTSPLSRGDLNVTNCESALVNDEEVPIDRIQELLARFADDVVHIRLKNQSVETEFRFDVRIASDDDLSGVEREVAKIARYPKLDARSIETLISNSQQYRTATRYCDGICGYLYGVLAKEGAPDIGISRESYIKKFNLAASELSDYERPLSYVIRALMEFHMNHFADADQLGGTSRIGMVSRIFRHWIEGSGSPPVTIQDEKPAVDAWENMLTEETTERVLSWAATPLAGLSGELGHIEYRLREEDVEYDRVKLQILMSEVLLKAGRGSAAVKLAKAVRNIPGLESWAERMIIRAGE